MTIETDTSSSSQKSSTAEFNVSRILVALRENEAVDYTFESPAITRALQLAEVFGASLHVCDVVQKTAPISSPLMIPAEAAAPMSSKQDHAEARLKRLLDKIRSTGFDAVDGSIVVDRPRAPGIIEQAVAVEADLILKQSRDQRYVLGLFSNTDWDLLRESPMPVWLTTGELTPDNGVLAAIECRLESGKDQRYFLDRRVFEASKALSDRFTAPHYLIHTYQANLDAYYPIYPDGMVSPQTAQKITAELTAEQEKIARQHGAAIKTFVDETGVPLDKLLLVQGDTASSIKTRAEEHQVGVVVMGADEGVSRWDRLFQEVHAEPTLDDAPCDLLFIH